MTSCVIFWFDRPPLVEKGAFNYFTRIWNGDTYYVLLNGHRAERKSANWDDSSFGDAKVLRLYNYERPDTVLRDFVSEHKDAIHVLNGFDTDIVKLIKPYLFREHSKMILFSERPAITGDLVERFIRKILLQIKYSKLAKEYLPHVSAFLPMGRQGVAAFRKCGIPESKLFEFMYCPELENISELRDISVHEPIKFLYVGRFYYKTKGTDVLMRALRYLKGSWTLDMAGGYGKNAEEVKNLIRQYDNVRYVGVWDSHAVVKNMQNYDVIVVPSKADGWNLLVNEALHAGISIISSDQAVSHEVLTNDINAGIFKSNDHLQLAAQMQKLIDDPSIVMDRMQKSRCIVSKINQETVGKYFTSIIEYTFFDGERPSCPWL